MGKYLMASFGFVAGIITMPVGMLIWPFFMAWFLYNEKED